MRTPFASLRLAAAALLLVLAVPAAADPVKDAPGNNAAGNNAAGNDAAGNDAAGNDAAGDNAAGKGAASPAAKAPAFRYSKRDLAAFYRPMRNHGVDWYERIGAARIKNERLRKTGHGERLILQMRALGPLDGST